MGTETGCLLVYTSEVNLPVKKQWKCIGMGHQGNTCMCAPECVLCVFAQRFGEENEKEQDEEHPERSRLRKRKIVKKVKENDREDDCDGEKQDVVV